MVERRHVLRLQAAYYCGSGLAPLLSMRLFEAITGKKRDRWLVQMVGLLAISIGASLWTSASAEDPDGGAIVLSTTAALAFAGIDVVHACRRRISPIYLADAAVELSIVALVIAGS